MSDFKAKMYQIKFRLGLRPRPRCSWRSLQAGGDYSAYPDPLAGLRGLTSKGRGGEGTGRGRGQEGEERVGEGRGREPALSRPPNPYFWIRPCNDQWA